MDGTRLREIRKDHGDTQESMGDKLGFSTPTVSKWEQGLSEPSYETLKRICRMYHVTSDYLLGLTDDDPLLTKKRRKIMSDESKKALQLFEEYLINRDWKRGKR